MNILYPGTVAFDATGRMMRPEYDMTLEQFHNAQHEIEMEFESDKSDAEAEVMDTYGDYFEIIGFIFNIEEYVIPGEPIPVKVLMPGGHVSKRSLETYELNIPEFKIAPKIWMWHSEHGENTCDECSVNDGTVFENKEDVPTCPVHPNCRCWVEEIELNKAGKKIGSKVYIGQKPEKKSEVQSDNATDKPTFEKPVNVKPGQYAVFDGKKFTLYENDKPIMSWDAVSGAKGYQSPEYQYVKKKGTIPEGAYVARQSELQHINVKGFVAGLVPGKHGEWPGSTISWGNSRVWLEPSKETNTYGRDDFSIHGGWVPGSAGCIDLTSNIDNFIALFEVLGNDLIIRVEY